MTLALSRRHSVCPSRQGLPATFLGPILALRISPLMLRGNSMHRFLIASLLAVTVSISVCAQLTSTRVACPIRRTFRPARRIGPTPPAPPQLMSPRAVPPAHPRRTSRPFSPSLRRPRRYVVSGPGQSELQQRGLCRRLGRSGHRRIQLLYPPELLGQPDRRHSFRHDGQFPWLCSAHRDRCAPQCLDKSFNRYFAVESRPAARRIGRI